MKVCYEAMGAAGGKYTGLEPFSMQLHTRSDIKPHWIFVLTMFGQAIRLKGPYKRRERPQDVAFETDWFSRVQELLDCGLVRPHPVRVMQGGLEALVEGINEVRLGKVSGEKLVYNIL
jgi:aspyridone synthetase trans-acting enoyl reductase